MEISEEEKDELTGLIKLRYGYDFSNYANASILRRIDRFTKLNKMQSFFELKNELMNDEALFSSFILEVTVNVTEMFRDPEFFVCLKKKVFPKLQTYPHRKIWHAGCSTGEEVYSTAVMLTESGLYNNTRIYATDINHKVLKQARDGVFPARAMKEYTTNYIRAGGEKSFSDYYSAQYDEAIMKSTLKKNVVFSMHNLVSDSSFNEFNLIICRNVMIYFNKELQERVLGLFYESLAPLGFLALGNRESLLFSEYRKYFEEVDKVNKIYRRID